MSMDAAYTPLPQAPVASAGVNVEEALDEESIPLYPTPSPPEIDARIRWIQFAMGSAVLLPWNALITATPYFLSRLQSTKLSATFSSYLSITFTVANFCVLAHATVTAKQSNPSRRTFLSMSWIILLVFLLDLSTYVSPSANPATSPFPSLFFFFVLLNGVLQATAGSYLQTAIIAVASLFGPEAMQALMAGQAAIGVAVSGVQVLSAAVSVRTASSLGSDEDAILSLGDGKAEAQSAYWFFMLSTLFMLGTLGAHAWLVRTPAYKGVIALRSKTIDTSSSAFSSSNRRLITGVAKANLVYEIAVAYVFVVTLAVFPPITTSVQPVPSSNIHLLLFNAIHFLLFNIGDFLGRYACALPFFHVWNAKKLLLMSLSRTIFIPLFLMCNVQRPDSSPTFEPPLINSNFLFFLIMVLFGFSNGHLSSMCMMSAPSLQHNPQLRAFAHRNDNRIHNSEEDTATGDLSDAHGVVDVAATVASFCLVGGLTLGSAASFIVRASVCKCNPFVG